MPTISPWQHHLNRWIECTECSLCSQRTQVVLAKGSIPADCLFVGEAPGVSEDSIGNPFVGIAGQLLDDIIEEAMPGEVQIDETGEDVFSKIDISMAYTNIVACFPREAKKTDNHDPPEEAIKKCQPRLTEFIDICKPKLIVTVGKLADKWVPKAFEKCEWEGLRLNGDLLPVLWCSIMHPSAILQSVIASRSLLIQKAVVTLRDALEEMAGVA